MRFLTVTAILVVLSIGMCLAPSAEVQRGPRPHMRELLKQADVNADGQVAYDELATVMPGLDKERFKRMDRNGDGMLSPADAREGRRSETAPRRPIARFHEADTNHDKQVTFEEFQAAAPKATREQFDRLDRNDDGVLSPADRAVGDRVGTEMRETLEALFEKADTNDDKQVTFEEIVAVKPDFPRERFKMLDRNNDGVLSKADRPPHPGRRAHKQGNVPGKGRPRLRDADANGDGKVTREEARTKFPNMPPAVFSWMDANGDGAISAADF
ncbi:MAG TPA: hypothetical protein ENN80_03720 [Candidatus Hydrogenedentes bacterium]|nr:hypothetical protein [Candidatus Hydrogenedentota bacterium]